MFYTKVTNASSPQMFESQHGYSQWRQEVRDAQNGFKGDGYNLAGIRRHQPADSGVLEGAAAAQPATGSQWFERSQF